MKPSKSTMRRLRKRIAQFDFLWVIDDASNSTSLAVADTRSGRSLGVSTTSHASLDYLLVYGAEQWLESSYNGMPIQTGGGKRG